MRSTANAVGLSGPIGLVSISAASGSFLVMDSSEAEIVTVSMRGTALLNEPSYNKGPAFTSAEREAFGLEGLLPTAVETLETQVERRWLEYGRLHDDLERHIFLRAVQDDNEVLYYALLERHLTEVLPIVYTPTVGVACQQFSRIYRRPRGLFVSYPDRHRMAQQLRSVDEEIDVIVVTDGERILGLGDQGIGGMGIPIGKLALYTAVGGVDPRRTLPVVLECGTNNQELLDDPLYMGWRHERVTGAAYEEFVEQFVAGVQECFPTALLQWEDFAQPNAAPLLARYRHRLLSFNDDIQGTAAVALAAITAAVGAVGSSLEDQRVCIVGAGSAGTGIAAMLSDALVEVGVDNSTANLFLVDRAGLLHEGRDDLSDYQKPFAQPPVGADGPQGLAEIVAYVRPTILIGVSGQPGLFTESIVRSMAAGVDRPIIFPMSNPTSRTEATPADLLTWTDGRALVATGSPFDPVPLSDGREVTISQANNVYIFPGVGVGALAAGASEVTESMLVAAAAAVAKSATKSEPSGADGGLLPPIDKVRDVSAAVALAVAEAAVAAKVAPAATSAVLGERVLSSRWLPRYPNLVPAQPS